MFYCTEPIGIASSFHYKSNINGKQTKPAAVRPKMKIHEPRVESGEFDINVQNLKDQVCQIQTQNVQQTARSTE